VASRSEVLPAYNCDMSFSELMEAHRYGEDGATTDASGVKSRKLVIDLALDVPTLGDWSVMVETGCCLQHLVQRGSHELDGLVVAVQVDESARDYLEWLDVLLPMDDRSDHVAMMLGVCGVPGAMPP
jgi:hypothetical protein